MQQIETADRRILTAKARLGMAPRAVLLDRAAARLVAEHGEGVVPLPSRATAAGV